MMRQIYHPPRDIDVAPRHSINETQKVIPENKQHTQALNERAIAFDKRA